MSETRRIPVFIASPNDVASERKRFKAVIGDLNRGFGEGANVVFDPLGWEDTLSTVGRRSQSVINLEVDKCEVFILVMWKRWGQEASDSKYDSYTEEEFHRALNRFKQTGSPRIFIFFKNIDPSYLEDVGPQLEKVLRFKRQLEKTSTVIYRTFDQGDDFAADLARHLKAYAKGDNKDLQLPEKTPVILPQSYIEELEAAKKEAKRKEKEAQKAHDKEAAALEKLEARQLRDAEKAAKYALEGMVEHAQQEFAELLSETVHPRVLYLCYEFFQRVGELDAAQKAMGQLLDVAGDADTAAKAVAYGNLGILYKVRGDLAQAEEMYGKSLELNEALGRKEGMANQYGNLGILYKVRGDLAQAEEMYRKSLELNEALGRKEGMAIQYGNLGILYQTRGDLAQAEEMYRKSLELEEALGRKEGMASAYGNLGILYKVRGDLVQAEEMHRKSLELNEALGRKEGMASDYGNLGNVYQARGDLEQAEEMYRKSLELEESLGRKEGMASDYGNLGNVYQARGDLEQAEEMHRKSLELEEALGRKEGMAIQYGNLGNVYQTRGDLAQAEEMYRKSLELNEVLGRKQGMAIQYGNLGNVYKARGDLAQADEMYRKSLQLFKYIGSPHVEKVQRLLDDLDGDDDGSSAPVAK